MAGIEELDDTAQRLRVMWRKTNNFYASFASILFDTKKQFEAGTYPDWTFDAWLFRKAGLSESYVMQQLKVFSRVINAEARDKVEQDVIRQAVEKRKAKRAALAERRAAAAERKVIAAHKKREQEQARAEREQLRSERQTRLLIAPPAIAAAMAKSSEGASKSKSAQSSAKSRVLAKARAEAGPENPILRDGLAECQKIEATSRVELGRVYLRLKEEVDMRRAGKSPGSGKFWTWGEWVSFYIKDRGLRSVQQCILEYRENLLNANGLRVERPENVIRFARGVGEVA